MGMLETAFTWTFTGSTGTGKAFHARSHAARLTVGMETSAGSTATLQILHRMGSSAGPYSVIASTTLTAGQFLTGSLTGPLEWIKPRVTDMTAGSTNLAYVYLSGN